MAKWTLALGLVPALACGGDAPTTPVPELTQGAEESVQPLVVSADEMPEEGAGYSPGTKVGAVEAPPEITRFCEHAAEANLVESWYERAETPAGAVRLCEAEMMKNKKLLDCFDPALDDGLWDAAAACLVDAAPQTEGVCYLMILERMQLPVTNPDILPLRPGLTDEQLATVRGPETVRRLCLAMAQKDDSRGVGGVGCPDPRLVAAQACLAGFIVYIDREDPDKWGPMVGVSGLDLDGPIEEATRCVEAAKDAAAADACVVQMKKDWEP